MMPDTHCPDHLRRVRRDTDAALAHQERDLAPATPANPRVWHVLLGLLVAGLVVWGVAP